MLAMNALKNGLRTFVAPITVLVCLSSIQGSAQVSDQEVMQFRKAAEQEAKEGELIIMPGKVSCV